MGSFIHGLMSMWYLLCVWLRYIQIPAGAKLTIITDACHRSATISESVVGSERGWRALMECIIRSLLLAVALVLICRLRLLASCA